MSSSNLTEIEEVGQETLGELIDRIVEAVDPQKIVLFGSHAYGEPHENSDLDLLVVMESDLPRYKRAVPIYQALTGLLIPKDVLVYTPKEIEEWKEVPQAFVTKILKKGRVIFEKE